MVSAEKMGLGNHGDKRRRRHRKQNQSELTCSVWQTQEAIDRARTAHQYNNMQWRVTCLYTRTTVFVPLSVIIIFNMQMCSAVSKFLAIAMRIDA